MARPFLRELQALADKYDATLTRTNSAHYKFTLPNGCRVYTSSTPSDHRALANVSAMLKRTARHE